MEPNYLRMLRKMSAAGGGGARDWSVYIVRCVDGSLYTGVAKDPEARVAKHNAGAGAAYTRSRRPVRLLHREDGMTRAQALSREARIKALPRDKKESLATNHGPVSG